MTTPSPFRVRLERQLGLWGARGQSRLLRAHVAVGGLGGIGAISALMLAKAGVGRLTVSDRDHYAVENVVEQAFATRDTVGIPKVEAALTELARHTDRTALAGFTGDLSNLRTARRLAAEADILVSGVDNPSARLALDRACRERGIPLVLSANIGWGILHTVYLPGGPGYAEGWRHLPGVRWRRGRPDLADPGTAAAIQREWDLWAVVLGGYLPDAARAFVQGGQGYYWYSAAPANFAASLGVSDTLKYLTGRGSVTAYPKVFYYDLLSNRELSWETLEQRRADLLEVWDEGAAAVLLQVKGWRHV